MFSPVGGGREPPRRALPPTRVVSCPPWRGPCRGALGEGVRGVARGALPSVHHAAQQVVGDVWEVEGPQPGFQAPPPPPLDTQHTCSSCPRDPSLQGSCLVSLAYFFLLPPRAQRGQFDHLPGPSVSCRCRCTSGLPRVGGGCHAVSSPPPLALRSPSLS